MLKTVSLEEKSLMVMEDISTDLNILEDVEIILKEFWSRNAEPPPTIDFLIFTGKTRRGKLRRL